MTTILKLDKKTDHRDVVHRVVEVLSQGGVAALPTDSTYVLVASSRQEAAVKTLHSLISKVSGIKAGNNGHCPQFALSVKSVSEAEDYIGHFETIAKRLAHRIWPGPLSLAVHSKEKEESTLTAALSETVKSTISWKDQLNIWSPSNLFMNEIQRLCPAPLVLGMPVLGEEAQTDCFHHDSFLALFEPSRLRLDNPEDMKLEISVDIQETRYSQSPTIVHVNAESYSIVRPGVVSETMLRRLAGEVILFVCTGNTCRSPMAEAMFRKMLVDRLQCSQDELMDHGYIICSAGISAAEGYAASEEAVELMKDSHIDLASHESHQLTGDLLDQSDHIYTMTAGHRQAILSQRPDVEDRIQLLSPEGKDISDPIGGGMRYYKQCADEIQSALEVRLKERL